MADFGSTHEPLMSVEEAQQRVLDAVAVLPVEHVPLVDALGRVLREDVRAPFDVPERDNSAMDGYALRAEDVSTAPVSLRVIDDLAAGRVGTLRVELGTAIRIMTGALLPDGADTVAQVEITDAGAEIVTIREPLRRGANVRKRGEDMRVGDIVLHAGTRLGAAELGVLAATQTSIVPVTKQPVVAIVATGDELVDLDEPRTPGKVVNSNAYALAALVREAGGIPRMLGIVRDDLAATVRMLEQAFESDFVITSGGVSVGAYDFVKKALEQLGAKQMLWRVAMKPGKPFLLASRGERLCFGLPGNPVSSMVSFHLFVAPALRKASGEVGNLLPASVRVRLEGALKSNGARRTFFRVRVFARGGELLAVPAKAQGSGVSTSMLQANGLAIVEEGVMGLASGELVETLLIGAILAG